MSTASRCITSILRLAYRLFAPALALFSVSCQPVNHFILHPRTPPETIITWNEEVRRGDLLVKLEWARPAGNGPFPSILIHHEFGRTADDMRGVAYDLAKAGYLAAAVGYRRLVNGRPETTPLPWRRPEDETAAYEVFRANPEVDRGRIGLLGFSMGGFQSLWIAARVGDGVRSVVAYYPVTDFGRWLDMTRGGSEWDVFIRRQIRGYFKRAAGVESDRVFDDYISNYSVVKHAAAITAPVLLIHGQKDPTVSIDQSRLLAVRLTALGRRAELLEIPHAVHVFNFKDASQAAEAWQATIDWFKETLVGAAGARRSSPTGDAGQYTILRCILLRLSILPFDTPLPAGYQEGEKIFTKAEADYEAGRYRPSAEGFWRAARLFRADKDTPDNAAITANRLAAYMNAVWVWETAGFRAEARRALEEAIRTDPACAGELREMAASLPE